MIVDGVLQNALKQHRQLGERFGRVFFRQLEHRVLHDIQRGIFVANRKHRLLECATFDFREKSRKFLVRSQGMFQEGAEFGGEL
jgi:hypothetical protein